MERIFRLILPVSSVLSNGLSDSKIVLKAATNGVDSTGGFIFGSERADFFLLSVWSRPHFVPLAIRPANAISPGRYSSR